jgi:hypothetical protein
MPAPGHRCVEPLLPPCPEPPKGGGEHGRCESQGPAHPCDPSLRSLLAIPPCDPPLRFRDLGAVWGFFGSGMQIGSWACSWTRLTRQAVVRVVCSQVEQGARFAGLHGLHGLPGLGLRGPDDAVKKWFGPSRARCRAENVGAARRCSSPSPAGSVGECAPAPLLGLASRCYGTTEPVECRMPRAAGCCIQEPYFRTGRTSRCIVVPAAPTRCNPPTRTHLHV